MGMKKLAALVMALMLCLTAVSAMAAVVTTVEQLENAINNTTDGSTITLGNDIAGHGIIIRENKNFVLDFADHTYTVNSTPLAGSNGTKTQAFQILKGSTITFKNGTIKVASPDVGVKMLIQNYSNLTLENMTLDGQNISSPKYVLSNNNCETNITGNTSIIAPAGGVAFDVYDYSAGYTGQAKVTVNTTGNIVGKIEVDGDKESSSNARPALTITNVGGGSDMEIVVDKKGTANLNNLPVGTEIDNRSSGAVTANGIELNKGQRVIIPAPYSAPVDLPQTGDNSSLMLWSAMLALAAAGFVVTRKTRLN